MATLIVNVTDEFKDKIGEYAATNGLNITTVVRMAVGQYIGYDISSEPKMGRPVKYKSKEERLAVQREKARQNRQLAARLLELYGHLEHLENINILERSLK